jgi:hypothetical protein
MTTDTIGSVGGEVIGVIEVASIVKDPGNTGAKPQQVQANDGDVRFLCLLDHFMISANCRKSPR